VVKIAEDGTKVKDDQQSKSHHRLKHAAAHIDVDGRFMDAMEQLRLYCVSRG
jgi:hypothetical protein